MLYKLNWGKHRVVKDRVTTIYEEGAIIETPLPLATLFPMKLNSEWKFTEVPSGPVPSRPAIASIVRSPSKSAGGVSEQPSPAVIVEEATEVIEEETPPSVKPSPIVDFGQFGEDVTGEVEDG